MTVAQNVASPNSDHPVNVEDLAKKQKQLQAEWTFYFLDWRPVSAAPIDDVGPVRTKQVNFADLQPYLQSSFIVVPGIQHLKSATLLARTDGLFVARIEIDPTGEFDLVNLDELALVVCLAGKEKLGHHHDVHSPKPFRRRSAIEPANLLITYPIELQPADWEDRFTAGTFTDADLKDSECVPPDNVPETETPRNALVCLRRAYLKVFEAIQAIVNLQRKEQIKWQRSLPQIWRLVLISLALIVVLYLIVVDSPKSLEEILPTLQRGLVSSTFLLSLIILLPLAWVFFSNLWQLLVFDRPRIRLLRSTETFYTYANPLNQVLSRVFKNRALNQIDGFDHLIATVQSKSTGEIHRASFHQLWLSLSLATIAIFFSALAVRQEITLPRTEALNIAGLDCAQGRWAVGPFKLGSHETLEHAARTPEEVVTAVLDAAYGRTIASVTVIGSTNAADFLATSEIQSNRDLAERRGLWVSKKMSTDLITRGLQVPEFVSLNESIDVTRIMLGVDDIASDKEAFVCIKWAKSGASGVEQ